MHLKHTLVLFVVSLFGNVLGLVISATFRTAKVIYIVIPLLVIPQIIFGGAIIRFERFNQARSHRKMPCLGLETSWHPAGASRRLRWISPGTTPTTSELDRMWEDRIYQVSDGDGTFGLAELKRRTDDALTDSWPN